MSILAIDWGERRLGLAISPDTHWAFPLRAYEVRSFPHAIAVIQEVVAAEHVDRIVLGLPLGLSGKDTAQTSRVREVAADLANVLQLPVALVDERLTSQRAQQELRDAGKRNVPDDVRAAVAILQTHLDLQQ